MLPTRALRLAQQLVVKVAYEREKVDKQFICLKVCLLLFTKKLVLLMYSLLKYFLLKMFKCMCADFSFKRLIKKHLTEICVNSDC